MTKPRWYRNLSNEWQEVVDQAFHFGLGFVLSTPLALFDLDLVGILVSVGVAIVREVIQNWGDDDNNYVDMATDLTSWAIGAIAASLVF